MNIYTFMSSQCTHIYNTNKKVSLFYALQEYALQIPNICLNAKELEFSVCFCVDSNSYPITMQPLKNSAAQWWKKYTVTGNVVFNPPICQKGLRDC